MRVRKLLYGGFALLTGVPLLWHLFEHFWDRRLFRKVLEGPFARNLGAEELAALLQEREELQVVDVRPGSAYGTCRLPGAVSVPFLSGELDAGGLAELDQRRPVAIYCDGGFRSRTSLAAFLVSGFPEVLHLHRGLLGWRLLGLPCEWGSADPPNPRNRPAAS